MWAGKGMGVVRDRVGDERNTLGMSKSQTDGKALAAGG